MARRTAASLVVAGLLLLGACGAGRPTAAELSRAMQKGIRVEGRTVQLEKAQADCAARIMVHSDLSDESLRAIADRDQEYRENKADRRALGAITDKLARCSLRGSGGAAG